MITISCDKSQKKYEYFENGHIKSIIELAENRKDGIETVYFESGNVFKVINWKDNKKHGVFKQYFPNGKLGVLINYNNDIRVGEMKLFYKSGELFQIQYYDTLGRLADVKEFEKNGIITDKIYPLCWIERDTVHLDETVNVVLGIGNSSRLGLIKGTAIMVSDFDSLNGKFIPKDTLAITRSDVNYYNFKFKASRIGTNFFKGQILLELNEDTLARFSYSQTYFVK